MDGFIITYVPAKIKHIRQDVTKDAPRYAFFPAPVYIPGRMWYNRRERCAL